MKIKNLLIAFSPLAFFYALTGNASAQFVVVGGGHGCHPGVVAHHPGVYHHQGGYPGFVHHNPYACYQQPSIFVGPQVVRYSNGDYAGGFVSGYGGSHFVTPGVTRVHTGSRGPFRVRPSVVSNLNRFGFTNGPTSSVPAATPAAKIPNGSEWMPMGSPEGGPVGTWFEDAPTAGNVFQYTVHGDGTYEMFEMKKNASGPMSLVTKIPARVSFSFEKGAMVLNPGGAYEEGPLAVSMSANMLGETRVILRDSKTGKVRVWRTAP